MQIIVYLSTPWLGEMKRFYLTNRGEPRPTPPFHGLSTSGLPQWLKRIMTNNRHRVIVLKELEDREVLRAKYRARSRFNNVPQLSSLSAPSVPAVHHPSDQNNTLEKFYSVSLAAAPRHQPLNRYSDIAPYDRGCVMVKQNDATGPSQYLNGSWVREVGGNAWCLATQVRRLLALFNPNPKRE
jgi:hypothetical protein